jgi:RNA polymerase sigma-70 factor (ECF subfamily)
MNGFALLGGGLPMDDATRPDVVALAQRGNTEAVGTLYDQHYPAILSYFRARLGDWHQAEDLTGDVFRRMLTGLPQYRPMGLPFRAWLFRIAHNVLIDLYRQESSRMSVALRETDHQSGSQDDPAAVVEHKLTMEYAHRALADLDQTQRDVLALRFLSGLSLKETALALGKTEDAIKALQRRGLAVLRLTLAQD